MPPIHYVCDRNITNKLITEKHIIPNFGCEKLKSKGIICFECNNIFGGNSDRIFGEQIAPLILRTPTEKGVNRS